MEIDHKEAKDFISNFFQFYSAAQQQIEKKLLKLIEKQQIDCIVDRRFYLEVKISNFPLLKFDPMNSSQIGKMVQSNSGYLSKIEQICFIEISKPINYVSKKTFKQNCSCADQPHSKETTFILRDYIKTNCDLFLGKKQDRIPTCSGCGAAYTEDVSAAIYRSYKIGRGVVDQVKSKEFLVYIEENGEKEERLRTGDIISGHFYVDFLLKLKNEEGRLEGVPEVVLILLQKEKVTESPISVGNRQNSVLKEVLKEAVQYAPTPNELCVNPSDLEKQKLNLRAFLDRFLLISTNLSNCSPVLDLGLLMLSIWIKISGGSSKLVLSRSAEETLAKEIWQDQKWFNIMIVSNSISPIIKRTENLLSGLCNTVIFPSHFEDKSIINWLAIQKKNVVIIPNLSELKKKVQIILMEAVQQRELTIDETKCKLDCSFIFIESRENLARGNEQFKSASLLLSKFQQAFLDNFDLTIDCTNESAILKATEPINDLTTVERICSIFEGSSVDNIESTHLASSDTSARGRSNFSAFSQNTRISYLCKKMSSNFVKTATKRNKDNFDKEEKNYELLKGKHFPKTQNIISSYLFGCKQETRLSMKNIFAFKKILSCQRVLKLLLLKQNFALDRFFEKENFCDKDFEITDVVLAISLFEESMICMFGQNCSVFGRTTMEFLRSIDSTLMSEDLYQGCRQSYAEMERVELDQAFQATLVKVNDFCDFFG